MDTAQAAVSAALNARECFIHAHVLGELGASPLRATTTRPDTDIAAELLATSALLRQSTKALTKEKTLSASLRMAVQRLTTEISSLARGPANLPPTRPDQSLISSWQGRDGESGDSTASLAGHARNEIMQKRSAARSHWTDASCQVGWVESTADKSCQAHDTDAALVRLRWAARSFCQRKSEKGLAHRILTDAKSDERIAANVLHHISSCRQHAEAQVAAAKRAREQYLEHSLQRKRQQEKDAVLPILPVVMDDYSDEPSRSTGCFRRAPENQDREARRKKKDEQNSLLTDHVREWSQMLSTARKERNDVEEALLSLHASTIRAAQSNLDAVQHLISQCRDLESVCTGDGARERLKNVALESTVFDLKTKVDCLEEIVAQQQHNWAQQVEDLETRDRLCVQEDIEIRHRALSAEKALTLTLERVRTLERAAARRKPAARCQASSDEVARLKQDLHKSRAAIAALSASLAFQQTRPAPGQMQRGGAEKHAYISTKSVLTPVAYDHSVLEDQLSQLQEAMDVFSPEWKKEVEMRTHSRQTRPGSPEHGQVLCLDDLETHRGVSKELSKAAASSPKSGSAPNSIRATMSVLASRNGGCGLLHLDGPYLNVAVDGCVVLARSVALEQEDGPECALAAGDREEGHWATKQYEFSVSQTSVIRLCVCDWTSNSNKAIHGVVEITVAQLLPVNWAAGAVVQKDWFAIRNVDGETVFACDGEAAELEILFRLE